jgi:hypothetical protein
VIWHCLALAVLLLPQGNAVPCKSFIASPQLVEAQIRTRGARAVLRELYVSWEDGLFTAAGEKPPFDCWGAVLAHISSGSAAWLEIGWKLRQGSDAGASQMLYQAIDDALDTNPASVLRLVEAKPSRLSLMDLCGSQIPVWADSLETAQAAIARRRLSLSKVSDPALSKPKSQCLALLAGLEKELPKYYEGETSQ